METLIFWKNTFPIAPGGNLYEWKNAETKFKILKNAKYYQVNMSLFDVYDYKNLSYSIQKYKNSNSLKGYIKYFINTVKQIIKVTLNNEADKAEDYRIIKNFNIEIKIKDIISL